MREIRTSGSTRGERLTALLLYRSSVAILLSMLLQASIGCAAPIY